MKKKFFAGLVALGLLLMPCLAQANGIDAGSDNTSGISEDSGDDTSTIIPGDGDGDIPVVDIGDSDSTAEDSEDEISDPPIVLISPPTGLRIATDGGGGGSQVTLAWNANPESYLEGYRVYWDIDSGPLYKNMTDVGNNVSCTLSGLPQDVIYTAITAYAAGGLESAFSDELVINNVPLPPSVILLGTGLLGLGLLGRRQRRG